MKRVAIITLHGAANAGGLERVVAQHVAYLKRGHAVRVFSLPERGLVGWLRYRWRWVDYAMIALFPFVSWLPARLWSGRRGLLLSHGQASIGLTCDAVFAHSCYAALARASGYKLGAYYLLSRAIQWLVARLAKRVICVSERVATEWAVHNGLIAQKSRVIHNSVDTSVFAPARPDEVVCAGVPLRVLFVGRADPLKGLDKLEQLHSQVAEVRPPVSVCLCFPTRPPPDVLARFPLFQAKWGLEPAGMAEQYGGADLFFLPSRYEAFELSSLEALACGTPVLLNATGTRPTLHLQGCPAVYDLESAPTPLAAVLDAASRFKGLRRETIACWTAEHFGGSSVPKVLGDLFTEMGLA